MALHLSSVLQLVNSSVCSFSLGTVYLHWIIGCRRLHPGVIEYLGNGHDSLSYCIAWKIYASAIVQFHFTAVEMVLAVRGTSRERSWSFINAEISIRALQQESSYCFPGRLSYFARIFFFDGERDIRSESQQRWELYILQAAASAAIPRVSSLWLGCHGLWRNGRYSCSIIVFSTHTSLMGLILLRHALARRAGWGRTPIVSLLLRDSGVTHLVISSKISMAGTVRYSWSLKALSLSAIIFSQLHDEVTTVMFLCI